MRKYFGIDGLGLTTGLNDSVSPFRKTEIKIPFTRILCELNKTVHVKSTKKVFDI